MSQYPPEWQRGVIQPVVRAAAGHRCEMCGMEFMVGTNLATLARDSRGRPIIGTVHHLDYNKANCDLSNLVYLCQSCHYSIHLTNWQPGKPYPPSLSERLERMCRRRSIHYPYPTQKRLWE